MLINMILEYKIVLLLFAAFIVISIYIKGYLLFFLRDPVRNIPLQDNIIVAPADGKVAYIRKIINGEIPVSIKSGEKVLLREITKSSLNEIRNGYIVGIWMSFFDVHIQRSPISGKVIDQAYVPGRFLDIKMNAKRMLREAERNILTLKDPVNNITVIAIQLASNSVRRIISLVNKGESLEIGQRYGYVKFGSQVDIIIPELKGLRFNIKKGEKIYAGETIIARYDLKNKA
jgi:phosphatidylserine decarboxylase